MHTPSSRLARSRPQYNLFSSKNTLTRRFSTPCFHAPTQARSAEKQRPVIHHYETCHNLPSRRLASTSRPSESSLNRSANNPEDDAKGRDTGEGEALDVRESGTTGGGKKFYGSYRRRATRTIPETKFSVPDWFTAKNVKLSEELDPVGSRLEVVEQRHDSTAEVTFQRSLPQQSHAGEVERGVYHIDKVIFDEISFMILGGLRASPASATEDSLNSRSHLLLQSPQPGAEAFLEAVVAKVAHNRNIDVLTIEPQDIADIAAASPEAFPERSLPSVKRLGFDTYIFEDEHEPPTAEEHGSDEADQEDNFEADDRSKPDSNPIQGIGTGPVTPLQHMIQVWFPNKGAAGRTPSSRRPPSKAFPNFFTVNKPEELFASTEFDATALISRFLDAPQLKRDKRTSNETARSSKDHPTSSLEHAVTEKDSRGLIVHVKDYLELSATGVGGDILDKIHSVIDTKRREGRPILIVGTSSSADLVPSLSQSGFAAMQAGSDEDKFRTIVTTSLTPDVDSIFVEDSKIRTAQINCRNIMSALRELYPQPSQLDPSLFIPNFGLSSEQMFQFDLAEEVWPLERVQRMTSIASGMLESHAAMSGQVLSLSLGIMEVSDRAKFDWVDEELKRQEPASSQSTQAQEKHEERRKNMIKGLNRYEKRLMGGVVNAERIRTTFKDVHVPIETVEALKTLTTLSLVRPEAFTYGVLATDRIPGLLLYGPPGTGKTLLAKAVAKESGATVLEVAGSDVYDMYVGEGEKNIRAIFTLAKKLSPCVVFIDEADAIFGSRSSTHNRKSHRELINQFLREWDGMNDLSAFIMVATNRPFDLDDAVLRRLPRRLLVDLPTEKDREAILKIHLKDEKLAAGVSLSELATQTPYYSGSDLKNLAVAAALACVREENEMAAKHRGEEVHKYPEQRTLLPAHFDKAMAEISASISEDMSSLAAIRKFDERYGDRRGRRKRAGGLGFGTTTEKDKERDKLEEGRVRRSEAL